MAYKAVLFDLDGTLLNTLDDLADSTNTVLASMGFPEHPSEAYKYFVGNGLRSLVKRALPEAWRSDGTVDAALDAMRKEYSQRWYVKTRPYEGIPELLDELEKRKIKLSVLSNKAHEFTKLIAEKFLSGWGFDPVFGERASVPRKPDPAAALQIADYLGLEPGEFIYLGDSGTDMQTAKNAGMYGVGALWGFRSKEELLGSGARKIIAAPADLLKLLDYAI